MGRLIDLTGKKFGRWTVIKRGEDRYDNRGYTMITWDCICDCNTERNVLGSSLRKGVSKSCGCLHKEVVSETLGKRDMVGKEFGRWTVLEEYGVLRDTISWWCKCECGTEREVTGTSLRNGTSVSCGCYNIEQTIEIVGKANKKYNKYDLESEEYGVGHTTKGERFTFDKEDFDLIYPYCWHTNPEGYFMAHDEGDRIRLHRLIMRLDFGDKRYVDHINHDLSNNQKSNLRVCKPSENARNQKLKSNNTSGVTGVYWRKNRDRWVADIMVNYKNIHLGSYDKFEDAVKARKEAEDKYFGEFSYDNSMLIDEESKEEKEND